MRHLLMFLILGQTGDWVGQRVITQYGTVLKLPIKEGDAVTGNRTKVKIVKNKVAAPFREAEFDILYGEGISREGDVLDLAVANNIVEKSGAWYSYAGERIGQGRENTRSFLKENKDIFARMDGEVRKKLNIGGAAKAEVPDVPVAGPAEAKEAVRGRRG